MTTYAASNSDIIEALQGLLGYVEHAVYEDLSGTPVALDPVDLYEVQLGRWVIASLNGDTEYLDDHPRPQGFLRPQV